MTAAWPTEREAILEAMKTPPADGYFVWDGVDEDDRPATPEKMQAGMAVALKKGDHPSCKSTPRILTMKAHVN